MVEAAIVDCAYVEGAYVDVPYAMSGVREAFEGLEPCLTKGRLAFLLVGPDMPEIEGLRLENGSK